MDASTKVGNSDGTEKSECGISKTVCCSIALGALSSKNMFFKLFKICPDPFLYQTPWLVGGCIMKVGLEGTECLWTHFSRATTETLLRMLLNAAEDAIDLLLKLNHHP